MRPGALLALPALSLLAVSAVWAGAATGPAAAGPAATAPAATVPIERGRVNTVVVTADVGAPLELAVPGRAYTRAAAADADQRWSEAEALYAEAISDWRAAARREPSPALDLAIAKAERERQRSQLLGLRDRAAANRAALGPNRRSETLEEARLLRFKLMAARATSGRVPPALFARTRARLEDALREPATAAGGLVAVIGRPPGDAEIHLLLCAVLAVGGEPEAARLARAHVAQADRDDPANLTTTAACAAALGETRAALAALELIALHPGPGPDRGGARDIYISNDWDRLRGDPRFESLFPR